MAEEKTAILKLIKLQHSRLSSLEKSFANYKKDPVTRKTKQYFTVRLERLSTLFNEFNTDHNYIVSSNVADDIEYIKNDVGIQFEELYVDYCSTMSSKQDELFPPSVENSQPSVATLHKCIHKTNTANQFEKIPTPTFSGKFIEWPSFYDSFTQLIHLNENLTNNQRFHYLKNALPRDTDVDIKSMLMTEENYKTAWELLKARYNNARILFAHHMNSIYQLPVIRKEDSSAIKNMLNAANVCINEFKSLSIPISECDHWLAHYLSTKLPSETHREWERHLGNSTTIPNFKELENFLLKELYTMDAIENRDIAQNIRPKNTVVNNHQKFSSNSKTGLRPGHKSQTFHSTTKQNQLSCALCPNKHAIRRCPSFLMKDCYERKEVVDKAKLCLNCLSSDHLWSNCKSNMNCKECGQRHHTLLHFPFNNSKSSSAATPVENPKQYAPNNRNQENFHNFNEPQSFTPKNSTLRVTSAHTSLTNNSSYQTSHGLTSTPQTIILATARVILRNSSQNQQGVFNALIDQGSEGTIISEHVAQRLNLSRQRTHVDICGINATKSNIAKFMVNCELLSNTDPNFVGYIENAYVLKTLNILLPGKNITPHPWPHINGLTLADPYYYQRKKIDLILGADIYAQILMPDVKRGKLYEPIAQLTSLGWIISGPTSASSKPATKIRCNVNLIELESLVQRFYEDDQIPEEPTPTTQNQWCENFFVETHKRQNNGKYVVRLPLKSYYDPNQTLGKSKQIAYNRFLHLERRFQRDPDLRHKYSDAIDDYFRLNQIRPATVSENNTMALTSLNKPTFNSCVLPHHAVIKEESLTTKVRIVFDASAKTSNGRSLNNLLCNGPALQNDLPAILLNWRLHKYVFLADIQKMYRCIDMHTDDTQFQRILWRNKEGEVQEFCLTTVTFGTASAPYTAIRVLHQLAHDEQHNFPLAKNILLNDMYVDDVLSGSATINQALMMQNQLISALKSAGMELRKWSSNAAELLHDIPIEHQACHPLRTLNDKDTVKTLGLVWNPKTDNFTFRVPTTTNTTMTKRSVLSTIARLYDPLGLVAPISVAAKIILKDIWSVKVQRSNGTSSSLDWDEPIPLPLYSRWQQFLDSFPDITQVTIPRWIHTYPHQQKLSLHAFCDGSQAAFAAAVYLRIEFPDKQVEVYLITAKCRVTPQKTLTIPRIELCGAVLATTLVKWTHKHLCKITEDISIHYWTDATIVLYWIYGDNSRWNTYVSNRVGKILSYSTSSQWNHVNTTENPADCATRGLTPQQLQNHKLWWNGPVWLLKSKDAWPTFKQNQLESQLHDVEEKIPKLRTHFSILKDSLIFRYSNLTKLIRIFAIGLRFRKNCMCRKKGEERQTGELTAIELQQSLYQIVRLVQGEAFSKEKSLISKELHLPSNSKLTSLTPFLDENNILRIRGRLKFSTLSYEQKHPIILPNDHHFTKLIILDAHQQTLHGGAQLTIATIRNKFWIINARRVVRAQLQKCIRCLRNKPLTTTQLMGDLPTNRVNPPSRPFAATGVDYAGPIELKASRYRGHTSYKGYIAIFICLATKAIHIEAVTGLTSEHFLLALQRFIGRRGLCHDIYSDCGTNFIGANKFIQENQNTFNSTIISKLATQNIQWHFNPPHSPNFGGLWESNVKSIKHHLKRVIGGNNLTYESLATVLIRIEACLNSRPLCPLTSDPDDLLVLTPAHFLIGESLLALPNMQTQPQGLTKHYMELQRMSQHFWTRWSSDWLSHLQARPKWKILEPNLKVGELVIVKDERLPPNQWTLGRITEIFPGSDQLVRVVMVRTSSGIYKRSISKICRLPMIEQ